MNRARAGLLAAIVALPLLALPAAGEHDGAVRLAPVTYVETSRSGTVDVVLHRDARVTLSGSDLGVRFAGRGRLLGLWLERDGGFGDRVVSYRLPAFAGGEQITYGSSPAPECTSTPSSTVPLYTECAAQEPQEALLRAGRYRLTVLTDGEPVRVTLRLRGLSGRETTVRPHRPLASRQQVLPVREDASAAMTFSDSVDLGTPAETFVVARAKATGAAALRGASVCRREDDAPAPPLAYGPSCPGGTSGAYAYTVDAGGQSYGLVGAFASGSSQEHRGPIGLGGSFTDSGGVQLEQALGVWLARP